jgi:hypothetical protein
LELELGLGETTGPTRSRIDSNISLYMTMLHARIFLRRTPFRGPRQLGRQSRRHAAHLEMPLQSRFRWSYLWYGSILALGISTGLGARHFAAPLGLPEPGSRDDERILASLDSDLDKLDIVQSLRKQSYSLHSDIVLTDSGDTKAHKGWIELDLNWRKAEKGRLLDSMSGTRGLGVQRAFWNAETREMVAVVWFGGGLAGWPGVAHGGAIATVFEETMARMVKGPNGPIGMAAPAVCATKLT